jgi:NAD(P)-dependent dehydrogenase (short-subunit alcohol dehydrogenase family)
MALDLTEKRILVVGAGGGIGAATGSDASNVVPLRRA